MLNDVRGEWPRIFAVLHGKWDENEPWARKNINQGHVPWKGRRDLFGGKNRRINQRSVEDFADEKRRTNPILPGIPYLAMGEEMAECMYMSSSLLLHSKRQLFVSSNDSSRKQEIELKPESEGFSCSLDSQ